VAYEVATTIDCPMAPMHPIVHSAQVSSKMSKVCGPAILAPAVTTAADMSAGSGARAPPGRLRSPAPNALASSDTFQSLRSGRMGEGVVKTWPGRLPFFYF
jgi:hypothetical protein